MTARLVTAIVLHCPYKSVPRPPSLAARNIHFLGPVVRHTRSSEECPGSGMGQRVSPGNLPRPSRSVGFIKSSLHAAARVAEPKMPLEVVDEAVDLVLPRIYCHQFRARRNAKARAAPGAGRRSEETDR
jgi:hypothetical protein